jgi:hypothetical protein
MKIMLLAVFLVLPFPPARAELSESAAKPVKIEETVKLSAEAAEGLFDRIRGAHLRAIQRGNLAFSTR